MRGLTGPLGASAAPVPLELSMVVDASYGASNLFFDIIRVPVKNEGTVSFNIVSNAINTYLAGGPPEGNILLRNSSSLSVAPGDTGYLLLLVSYQSAGGGNIASKVFEVSLAYNITASFTGGATSNRTGTLQGLWTISGSQGSTKSVTPSLSTWPVLLKFTN